MSIKARIAKLWAAAAARNDQDPKLTRPGGEPIVLHADDISGIEAARAQGRMVWICDEAPPAAGVIF